MGLNPTLGLENGLDLVIGTGIGNLSEQKLERRQTWLGQELDLEGLQKIERTFEKKLLGLDARETRRRNSRGREEEKKKRKMTTDRMETEARR